MYRGSPLLFVAAGTRDGNAKTRYLFAALTNPNCEPGLRAIDSNGWPVAGVIRCRGDDSLIERWR